MDIIKPKSEKNIAAILAAVLIFVFGFGCSGRLHHRSESENDSLKSKRVPDLLNLKVEAVDEEKLNRILAQLHGKVVLVNFWATWCLPCVEEFPYLIMLDNKYKAKGLETIAVSFDDVNQLEAKVLPFIKSHNVRFKVYLKDVEDNEKFINAIDKNWVGALPATLVFDRNGTLVKSIVGEQTLESFENIVLPFL